MHFSTLALASLGLLAAPLTSANNHHGNARHHSNRAHNITPTHEKRGFGGTATFFDVGLGACGEHNVASDYIVALNTPQYGSGSPGPQCFKSILISARGKTAVAKIMDECPTCGYGDLDMSRGLFKHFASEDDGVFQMSWSFIGGGGGGSGGGHHDDDDDDDKPKPKPTTHKTTHTPDPPKTTKKPDPPKTTKTPDPEPTSTKKDDDDDDKKKEKETSSKPQPTTTSSKPSSSSSSATPSATPTKAPDAGNNFDNAEQALLEMGAVVARGAKH